MRIEYFDSLKYNVNWLGIKNFYWVSNFLKNYRDTTTNAAINNPELSCGQKIEMGYKCAQFGRAASIYTGKSFLEYKNDKLYIL